MKWQIAFILNLLTVIFLMSASPSSAEDCKALPDFYSPWGRDAASSRFQGALVFVARPIYDADGKIDLLRSRDVWVFSEGGCYVVPVADGRTLSLSINNVSNGAAASGRTFLGVQIAQLGGGANQHDVKFEISRDVSFSRGTKMLRAVPARLLPISLDEWDSAHNADDVSKNDLILNASWHGAPQDGDDDSWSFRRCWLLRLTCH